MADSPTKDCFTLADATWPRPSVVIRITRPCIEPAKSSRLFRLVIFSVDPRRPRVIDAGLLMIRKVGKFT